MSLMLLDARTKQPVQREYLVHLPGWDEARYLAEAPENAFWEFVRGEVIVHSPVYAEHQEVVLFLTGLLRGFCQHTGQCGPVLTGPAGLRLGPEVIREPDIFVLAPEDAGKVRGFPVEARPLLVVEVVSPSTRRLDLEVKPQEYAQAGVPEYWVVDRERRVFHQHLLEGHTYRVERHREGRVQARALPGFWLQVAWLWQDPLPPETRLLPRILAPDR